MTQNQIDYAKLLESRRSNRAQEAQTALRDQRAYEVNFFNALETQRANKMREAQNTRSQVEAERANRAKEAQAQNQLAEDVRYHSMTVGLGYAQLGETRRSNEEREKETNRHNKADENIRATAERTRSQEVGVKMSEARTHKKEAETKANQLKLDTQKFAHQQIMDQKNYGLESRRVDLQEQHQNAIDPVYADSLYWRGEYDKARTASEGFKLGKDIVSYIETASVINLFNQ